MTRELNETSRQLVDAACSALIAHRVRTIAPDPELLAKIATAAVLRELSIMMNVDELDALSDGPDEDWPDAGDLALLARDVEASL